MSGDDIPGSAVDAEENSAVADSDDDFPDDALAAEASDCSADCG